MKAPASCDLYNAAMIAHVGAPMQKLGAHVSIATLGGKVKVGMHGPCKEYM